MYTGDQALNHSCTACINTGNLYAWGFYYPSDCRPVRN